MEILPPLLLIGVPIVSFVMTFLLRAYAQNVFDKTGYNAISETNVMLMRGMFLAPMLVGLILELMGMAEFKMNMIFCALIIGFLVALVIRNLQSKNPVSIILLTIMQVICGLALVLWWFIKTALKMLFHSVGGDLNYGLSTPKTANEEVAALHLQQRASSEADRQYQTDRANQYAQKQGFRDADEAERAGIKTGKPQ